MIQLPGILTTGTRAANWYHLRIQALAREKWGEDFVFGLKSLQIPFEKINSLLPDQLQQAASLLEPYLEEMHHMGAEPFVLGNITLHEALPYLPDISRRRLRLIDLPDILASLDHRPGEKVAILGTHHTMQAAFFSQLMERHGFSVSPLPEDIQAKIDGLRRRYYHHSDPALAQVTFEEIIGSSPPGIDRYVIACTELSIARTDYGHAYRFLDLAELQCRALVTSVV